MNRKYYYRIVVAIAIFLAVSLGVLLYISLIQIKKSFNEVFSIDNIESSQRTEAVEQLEHQTLLKTTFDYSDWDEVYNQADNPDEEWLSENVAGWVPENFDIDWVIMANKSGDIFLDYQNHPEFAENVKKYSIFQQIYNSKVDYISGLISLKDGLYFVALSSIKHSDKSGPMNGVVLMGKKISDEFANKVSLLEGAQASYFNGDLLVASTSNISGAIGSSLKTTSPEAYDNVIVKNATYQDYKGDLIYYYSPLKDIDNNTVGIRCIANSTQSLGNLRDKAKIVTIVNISIYFMIEIIILIFALLYVSKHERQSDKV